MICVYATINLLISANYERDFKIDSLEPRAVAVAQALAYHGALVDPENPTEPYRRWVPLYPIFMAGLIKVFGDNFMPALYFVQALLVLAIGGMTGMIVQRCLGAWGIFAMAMVILNPLSIGLVHVARNEILLGFMLTLSIWSMVRFSVSPRMGWAVVAGAALGLCALTRATFFYPIILLPIPFLLARWRLGGEGSIRAGAGAGGVALLAAVLIISPWLVRNAQIGEGLLVPSSAKLNSFLHDQADALSGARFDRLQGSGGRDAAWRAKFEADKKQYHELDLAGRERDHLSAVYRTATGRDVVWTLALSWLHYFAAPGTGRIRGLVGYGGTDASADIMNLLDIRNFAGTKLTKATSNIIPLLISSWGILLVVLSRILGVLGIIAIVAKRDWLMLVLTTGPICFLMVASLFIGVSRYRAPVEPAFAILAAYGLSWLMARWTARGRTN